ncbi:MAG TPA: PepSY domain-containing protein, partial [Verrucomicrobiae bacterium]
TRVPNSNSEERTTQVSDSASQQTLGRRNRAPVSITVRERGAWPLFSSVNLTLDPFTGEVLRKESFSDYNLGRQVRSWTRFLHTGEALGNIGQIVAGLASLLSLLLVWTGFALAWRRFFGRKKNAVA